MPISLKEYNDGIEPKDTELLARLEHQPYQAYSLSDLAPPETEHAGLYLAKTLTLHLQLERLVEKGLVKSKRVGGTIYYLSAKAR